MRTSANVEALLDVENRAPDVLFSVLPGTQIPIWPYLRQPLAQAAANKELGTMAVKRDTRNVQLLAKIVRNLTPNRHSSRHMPRDKDLLFLANGGTIRQTSTARTNWLVDPFAQAYEDRSVVLQLLPLNTESVPAFRETFSFADSLSRVELLTKASPLPALSQRLVREAVRETIREFPFSLGTEKVTALEQRVIYSLGRAKHETASFAKALDRVRPRIAFLDGASYGARAHLTALLKDREILVAEPQHGWIGPYHTAYNFGAAMSTPKLFATLPDVLLTFGDFWSGNIRHPARVVAIGKPHLEVMSAHSAETGSKKKEVIVVSSVFQREELTSATLELRSQLPSDWTVRFRPHPSERASVADLYPKLVDRQGIEIDTNSDVTTSLLSAKGVLGFSSTVLYEALAFNCHVAVIDSPLADYSSDVATFGERVGNAQSMSRLVDRIVAFEYEQLHPNLNDIWKPNSIENFKRFVNSAIAGVE